LYCAPVGRQVERVLTIVALVVLIAIWGVFLGVTLVRKRAEYRADSSIGKFQRQLQVLRRNAQVTNRNHSSGLHAVSPDLPPSAPQLAPSQLSLSPLRPYGQPSRTSEDAFFSRQARERRRDVLLVLASIFVGTGLIAIIPQARLALVLTGLAGLLLVAYIALLIRTQARASERSLKLRYMPTQPQQAPTFTDRRVVAR
jgi:hypothetical protein